VRFECQTSFEADCFVVHESGLLAMTRGGCCKQGSGFKVRGFKFAQVLTLNSRTSNVELFNIEH